MNNLYDLRNFYDFALRPPPLAAQASTLSRKERRRMKKKQRRAREREWLRVLAARGPVKKSSNKKPSNVLDNRRKQFPRLSDPEQAGKLAELYEPYIENCHNYYSMVAGVAMYLRAHLNDRSVLRSANGYTENGVVAGAKKPEQIYQDSYKNAIKEAAGPGNYLEISGDEIKLSLHPLEFQVNFRLNDETEDSLGDKLKTLFPNFTFPTRYQRDEAGVRHLATGLGKNDQDQPNKYTTDVKPISWFQSKLKWPTNEHPGYYQPEELEFIEEGGRTKQIINATNARVTLHEFVVDDYRGRYSSDTSAGAVGDLLMKMTFRVSGILIFPLEFALWATHATDLTEFVPKLFREHLDNHAQLAVGNKAVKKLRLAKRTMHIGVVKQYNEQKIKDYQITVRPRTNAEGFTILMDGSVMYVPNVDNSDNYVKALRQSYDPEKKIVKRNSDIPELHNLPLYTDWINDAFAYTDNNGTPSARKLTGSVPLDDITIARSLHVSLQEQNQDFITNTGQMGSKLVGEFNLYTDSDDRDLMFARSYSGLLVYLRDNVGDSPWWQVVEDAFSNKAIEDTVLHNERNRKLVREFIRLNTAIANNLMESKDYAISTKCSTLYRFYIFGPYVQKGRKFIEEYQKGRERNALVPENMLPDKFTVPNLPGSDQVMVHQAQTLAQSDKSPYFMVLDIAAGGGKTFQLLADVMILLKKGAIKRPMVICPGVLVSEWTNEINRASKGMVNVIPITAPIIEKMVNHLNWKPEEGRAKYLKYLQSAPPNTIFVCSLNFLSRSKDYFTGENLGNDLQFGETWVKFYPSVQLLRQLNPDYIALDESHYAKNADAQRTEAMYMLSPVAKYRRVASGTIMQNDPTDMVSQYGLLNPAIFGTKKRYLEDYGIEENGKFVGLQPGAEHLIARVREPYAVRINKARRDWAHVMPIIRSKLWEVNLTEAQQQFYDFILADALDKLRNDPKLKDLWDKADEDTMKKLEKALDDGLAVLEQFINAPDENPAFANRENVRRGDLVSPKVRVIDYIIDRHFTGYTDTDRDNRPINFPPDPNKIIVFCYNRSVSKHIWRNTKHQNIAIHYARAGSEPGRDAGPNAAAMTGEEALLRFRSDPKIKVLIADETSIREGLNLQLASRVIRVQSLFSPGAQEQANSRAMRPDVRNEYGREFIHIDWLQTKRTFEVGKTARVMAKMVNNFKVQEAENPEWNTFIKDSPVPNLQLIRLNPRLLQGIIDSESQEVADYFDSYETIMAWEEKQFLDTRARYRKMFARKLNKPESEIDLRRDAKFALDGKSEKLPGTRPVWVPLAPGAMPIDHRGLNLSPVAILKKPENTSQEDELNDDEEGGEQETIVQLQREDVVQTEYGFGYIRASTPSGEWNLRKKIRVVVPGFNGNYPIAMDRRSVFKPVPPVRDREESDKQYATRVAQWEANVEKLKKDLAKAEKAGKGILFIDGGYVEPDTTAVPVEVRETRERPIKPPPTTTAPPPAATPPSAPPQSTNTRKPPPAENIRVVRTEEEKPKPGPKGAPSKPFIMDAAVINGVPAVIAYHDEEGLDWLADQPGQTWWQTVPFMVAHVQTYQGAQRLVKAIRKGYPGSFDEHLDNILDVAGKLRHRTSDNLLVRGKSTMHQNMTNFFKLEHKKSDDDQLRVYPFILNDELMVCASIPNQPKQARALRNLRISGVSPFQQGDPMAIHFGSSLANLKRFMEKITATGLRMRNVNGTLKVLSDPLTKRLLGL